MSARDGGSTKRGQSGRMANLPSLARYFLKPEYRSSRVLCARSGALLSYLTLPLFEFTSIFHVPLPALLLPRPIVMLPSLIHSNDDRSVGQPIWSPIARASFQNCHFKTVILSETGSALSVLPMESKNPILAAVGSSLDGNSLNSLVRTPVGIRWTQGVLRLRVHFAGGEADTPLRMTPL